MSSTVQSIGDRITYAWHEDALTIIIDQAIPRTQQMMLEGWFLAVGRGRSDSGGDGRCHRERPYLLPRFLAFWAFAFRCSR